MVDLKQQLNAIDYFGVVAVWLSFFSIIFIISVTCILWCCVSKDDDSTVFAKQITKSGAQLEHTFGCFLNLSACRAFQFVECEAREYLLARLYHSTPIELAQQAEADNSDSFVSSANGICSPAILNSVVEKALLNL
ncbi:hypothetical protein OESDEN_00251 [Oesophagostomum dentatum]|uniref:Uncharacterized protein n=1 Tax=Oesophagostomum dentatum TaxID=61180 RepID=A0A0B1TV59_OESDE|nr:hypothetical protein OESDEN_00251 [Oesophagostomum dentatum]